MDAYDKHSGFWRSSTFTAGIVLLLVLLLAGYLILGRNDHSGHQATTRPRSPAATPTRHAGNGKAKTAGTTINSGCSLPAGSQTIPEMTPEGITWKLYQTVALPYSKTAGPQIVTAGGVARCYAHDPLGALIAASQLLVRYLASSDWSEVVELQVMPGAGRAIYVRERASVGDTGGVQPGSLNQFAGFKFVTYTPAVAVIDLVTTNSSGAMQVTTSTLDWSGGDWKLALQSNGSDSPDVLPVTSLAGFSIWSGV